VAYEQQEVSRGAAAASAVIHPVAATWSVSDSLIASVESNGRLTGLRPGPVEVRAAWRRQQIVTSVEVVRQLNVDSLPLLTATETRSSINEIKLDFSPDRTLRFRLSFDDTRDDITLETKAPEQPLPWEFRSERGTLKLTSASGRAVSGEVQSIAGGKVSFTIWSDGDGAYPVSLKDKTVLLLGDSMAEGLGWFLREKVESAGGRYIIEPWQSSTIVSWESGRLKQALARHKPDILFIALGSNELFVERPEQTRAPQIRQLTKDIGDLPAYWIGPPSWKPDNGLVRVIQENFQPEHFYNSNDLKVPRRADGAHPTREGFELWANLVWDWYSRTG
jgi:lysophospholipase L1-like esterase